MQDMPGMKPDGGGISYELGQHAFVMAGRKTLFLCHLTMLHMEEHAFEFVIRAQIEPDAQAAWEADSAQHPDETYFLGNTEKDLMAIPDLAIGARTSFQASIWAGVPIRHSYKSWPWKKIKPIVAETTVTVERVVAFRHFDIQENYPETLTYLLFGAGEEAHLSHFQVREPDFDEVLTLDRAPAWLPKPLLEAGVHVNFPNLHATPVDCSSPLLNPLYEVQYCGQPATYKLRIKRSLWFSTKVTNATDPCQTTASATG